MRLLSLFGFRGFDAVELNGDIVGNGDEDEPDDGKALGIAAVLVICIVAIVVIVGVAVGCRFIAKEMGW